MLSRADEGGSFMIARPGSLASDYMFGSTFLSSSALFSNPVSILSQIKRRYRLTVKR
jgi:hypothetical protein